jgi:hypothetical protein
MIHYGLEYETKISQAKADKIIGKHAKIGWEYTVASKRLSNGFLLVLHVYNKSGQCFIGSYTNTKSEWVEVFGKEYEIYTK